MRYFSIVFVFCLLGCGNGVKYTPQEMAQEACECLRLSNTPAFVDCDSTIQEILKPYESNLKWMGEFREELMRNLKDCTSDLELSNEIH